MPRDTQQEGGLPEREAPGCLGVPLLPIPNLAASPKMLKDHMILKRENMVCGASTPQSARPHCALWWALGGSFTALLRWTGHHQGGTHGQPRFSCADHGDRGPLTLEVSWAPVPAPCASCGQRQSPRPPLTVPCQGRVTPTLGLGQQLWGTGPPQEMQVFFLPVFSIILSNISSWALLLG